MEPHYGGSHRAFLEGWIRHSRHNWTVLGLPAYHWKWRMRHGALSLAVRLEEQHEGERWDLLFCSDMLDLPGFLGHASGLLPDMPAVVYFHENQLTYPVRREDERDLHFAFSNVATAYAAASVWFNSAFHRDEFLTAAREFLGRMPSGLPEGIVPRIQEKAVVEPPGIAAISQNAVPSEGPLRILWAARWEFDKRPQDFFAALNLLLERGGDFRVSVVGEQFREIPPEFEQAKSRLQGRIDRWGYQESRAAYEQCLRDADVVVSTAIHEFFGLSVVEAISAGARPLLPRRLAYPEILASLGRKAESCFYDGTVEDLADRLAEAATCRTKLRSVANESRLAVERFFWGRRASQMDNRLEEVFRVYAAQQGQ